MQRNVVKVRIMGKVMVDSCQRYQSPIVDSQSYPDSDWGIQEEDNLQFGVPKKSPFGTLLPTPLAQQNLQQKTMNMKIKRINKIMVLRFYCLEKHSL